ncbi:MAG: polysaccharide biosynthesis/export family protein [Erythrobacter sp.]
MIAACSSYRSAAVPYGIENISPANFADSALVDPSYRIAPLDVLSVQVLRVPDLSGALTVDPAGQVNMPLLGAVSAQGLTARELSQRLEVLYGSEFLRDPRVVVNVVEAKGNMITIDGSVRQPGLYPITNKSTLLQAIATARGLDRGAKSSAVLIFREIEGERMAAAFDLRQIRRGEMDDPLLQQGDVIVVQKSRSGQFFDDFTTASPLIAGVFVPLAIFGVFR